MQNNKVAVIMTVYKYDDYNHIKLALKSITSQSLSNYRVFLGVDGPISLNLLSLLKEFELSSPNFQLILFDENRGLASTLNELVRIILRDGSYDFIARMDADDISHSTRLNRQVEYFNHHQNISVCGTSCKEFGATFAKKVKHLPTAHDDLLAFSITRCPFIHPTVMFRSSVFISGNFYPLDTTLTEDMAFWFNLLERGYKFGNINEVLLDYRLNENTIERRKGIGKAISEIKIRLVYMFRLKQVNVRNFLLIASRLIFHLMPSKLVKLAYKFAR